MRDGLLPTESDTVGDVEGAAPRVTDAEGVAEGLPVLQTAKIPVLGLHCGTEQPSGLVHVRFCSLDPGTQPLPA